MEAQAFGKRLDEVFPGRVQWTAHTPKRLYVNLAPGDLVEVVTWCRETFDGFRLGTATGIDLRDGVGVFHHFVINGLPLVVTMKVVARKPHPTVPSLTPLIPAAGWIEREIHDLLGVDFEGHPDLRRLVKAEAFPHVHPLRRDFSPADFKESIGERLDY